MNSPPPISIRLLSISIRLLGIHLVSTDTDSVQRRQFVLITSTCTEKRMGRKAKETTEEERRIVVSQFKSGKTYKEIGEIIGRPITTVKSIITGTTRLRNT